MHTRQMSPHTTKPSMILKVNIKCSQFHSYNQTVKIKKAYFFKINVLYMRNNTKEYRWKTILRVKENEDLGSFP